MSIVPSTFVSKLSLLLEKRVISEDIYHHFINRGLNVVRPSKDFGLYHLGKILPEIVIGASSNYVSKMKVPYQATSYVAARTRKDGKAIYIYKINGKPGGGVLALTGDVRKSGDSVFASTHRILVGSSAMIISADNLVVNKEHIWNWQFFGNAIRKLHPQVYEDLRKLNDKLNTNSIFHQFVVARSDKTFRRLKIADLYQKNQIRILNPENEIRTVFLTNQSGYDYFSKILPESSLIHYVSTGKDFDTYTAMVQIRRDYGISMILNDGGRILSNSLRDLGILGEERVTLEPYPGNEFISHSGTIESGSVLGVEGAGIDGGEIEKGIKINSRKIGKELANVYLYPLNERLCM